MNANAHVWMHEKKTKKQKYVCKQFVHELEYSAYGYLPI